MAVKTIKEYDVLHYLDGKTRVNVHFTDGSNDCYTDLDPTRALLVLDILRNERPVRWTDTTKVLWAGREPVGEGEDSGDTKVT